MEKKTILWIHGFAGRPNNDKVQYMMKHYPEYDWYSIEVDHHALTSMQKINEYIKTHDVSLVAGTSLGGYYAMCAEFEGPKLVVNPVVNPVRDLQQFLGKNTYKPGRPDGQLEFDFTEEMLQEFGQLKLQSLNNVLCHYAPKDQVLGDDIKHDYEQMFYHLQMVDEKVLNNHFLSFSYIKKGMKEALNLIFFEKIMTPHNIYDDIGYDYVYIPTHMLPKVEMVYRFGNNALNRKKLLAEIEQSIRDVKDEFYRNWDKAYTIGPLEDIRMNLITKELLKARKRLLDDMFVLTQESFDALKQINQTLLELTNKMNAKLKQMYEWWLENETDEWNDYCQVIGKIMTDLDNVIKIPDDTGSDYKTMAEFIIQVEDIDIYKIEFSGNPDLSCDAYKLGIEPERPNTWFSYGGEKPFGDFLMCKAFKHLLSESLYSKQDILRIATFSCDAELVDQYGVNQKGELLK